MRDLLSKLLSSSMARSFALGLSGVVGTYLLQWFSTADFGPTWTPLLAGLLPVLVNWARLQVPAPPPPDDGPKTDPLGPLSQEQLKALAGDHDDDKPDVLKFRMLLVPLLWLACSTAQAAPLKAVLVGPTSAEAGSDVFLDATQSEGEIAHFLYRVTPELQGRRQIVTSDKTRPRILTYPGKWTIELIVVSEDGEQSRAYHELTIPGGTPCPAPEPKPVPPSPTPVDPVPPRPPAPEPTPPPNPVDPTPPVPPEPTPPPTPPAPTPGRFGLRDRVRTAVLGINSPTRAAEVAKLRARLADIKSEAAAGKLTQQQILNGMVDELKSLPGTWQLVKTLASLGIQFLVNGKQLQTVQDWVDLLAEILDALTGL